METNKSWCLYKHTNKLNGKSYIGITSQELKARWKNGEGYAECPKFYNAIKKYGWDNFTHEVILIKLTFEDACNFEKEYIKKYDTINNGYNILQGGGGSLGRVCSEETKRKIGSANSGENNWLYGKHCPEYLKKKISDANKGKVFTEGHRRKLSEAHKGLHIRGDNVNAKRVLAEGRVFSCAKDFADYLDINPTCLRGWLGHERKAPYFLAPFYIGYENEEPIVSFSKQKPRECLRKKENEIVYKLNKLRKEAKNGEG